jgi:TetR/AcrR family transcriptional repressor of nem operon
MGRTSDARERLLDAAVELITHSSYGSVGVDQICEHAGVKKGSFYHFFRSKEHLALEAYEHHWRTEIGPEHERLFAPSIPPLERIAGLGRAIYEEQKSYFLEHGHVPGCPMCSIASELAAENEALRRKAEELLERGHRYVERAIADASTAGELPAGDAATRARTLTTLILGAMLEAKVHNDPERLRPLSWQLLEVLGAKPETVLGVTQPGMTRPDAP